MKLGYLAIDQYGSTYNLTSADHPRKQLGAKLGLNPAGFRKMYRDGADGAAHHVGYICGRLWIELHEVHEWEGGRA